MYRKLLPVSLDFLRVTAKFSFSPHQTMALSNFNKTLKTPFVGAFQMIADPLGLILTYEENSNEPNINY